MALTTRKNNQTIPYAKLVKELAPAITVAGAKIILGNQEAIWNGSKLVWQTLTRKGSKPGKVGNGAIIPHPQSFGGAIAAPTSYTYPVKGNQPRFQQTSGGVRISHREYVTSVSGTAGTFLLNGGNGDKQDYSVNPLNPFVFPWLTSIAANFDQYTVCSLRLSYVPLANTSTAGRVALFFDKDSGDPGPSDRSALANYKHLAEISPWGMTRLPIPRDNVKRFMADNATSDPKLVNFGKIGYVTYGGPTGEYGDLFIEYTIDLFEPQPTSLPITDLFTSGATTTITGLPITTIESFDSSSANYQFRVGGTYLINFIANVTSNAFAVPTISAGGTIISSSGVASAAKFSYTAMISLDRNVNFSFTGMTGLNNFQLFVVRATAQTRVRA